MSVRALLNILLADAILFFNVGKTMDADQVKQTVDLIIQEYHYFKPEDFKSCFSKAMKGHYGKLYDRIDGQVIMLWLAAYDDERSEAVESARANQCRIDKENAKDLASMVAGDETEDRERFIRNITKLRDDMEKRRKERLEALNQPKPVNHDPVYLMNQRWFKQFDEIWKRQGYPKGRLIQRYGKVKNPYFRPDKPGEPKRIFRRISIGEFMEHKQWQYEQAIKRQTK